MHAAPTAPDPWLDIYLPALLGEAAVARGALAAADAAGPPTDLLDTVAVRALAALGDAEAAAARARRAFARGGPEAAALAIWLGPRRRARAEARLAVVREPGLAADAACDLAALCLEEGDEDGARRAVRAARGGCAGHLEAARWARFFADCPVPVRAWRGLGPVPAAVRGDVTALRPRPARGWVAPERLRRRVLLLPPGGLPPPATAQAALRHAGAEGGRVVPRAELAERRASDPGVALELVAETLLALVDEGRDGAGAARRLVTHAEAAGVIEAACEVIVAAASRDDRLAEAGAGAAVRLRQARREERTRWAAWEALFLRSLHPCRAVRLARRVLEDPAADALAWQVALDALRLCGLGGEARVLAAGESRPDRVAAREAFLLRPDAAPPLRVPLRGAGWGSSPSRPGLPDGLRPRPPLLEQLPVPAGRRLQPVLQERRPPDDGEGVGGLRPGLRALGVLHGVGAGPPGVEEAQESPQVELLARGVEYVAGLGGREPHAERGPGEVEVDHRDREPGGEGDHVAGVHREVDRRELPGLGRPEQVLGRGLAAPGGLEPSVAQEVADGAPHRLVRRRQG